MNKRIRELAEQSGAYWYHGYFNMPSVVEFQEGDIQEFAKLIAQECIGILRTEMNRLDTIPGREVSAQTLETAQVLIKNHFGVKE